MFVRKLFRTSNCPFFLLLLAVVAVSSPAKADQTIKFQVTAGEFDRTNTPIRMEIAVEQALKGIATADVRDASGNAANTLIAQITEPSLLAKSVVGDAGTVPRELHFILPELKAGESKEFSVTISATPIQNKLGKEFVWKDTPGAYDDLMFGNRAVLRYMYHPLDESSAYSRMETFKVYHHVFDPDTGMEVLTKGPGGLWPHHHGVFYGFRKVTYDNDKTCDIWHCPAAFQEHSQFLAQEAGPVLGRQLIEINWVAEPKLESKAKGTESNQLFAREKREVTAYNIHGGTLIEFASHLDALLPPVHLDGDPQHSGFHFRASDEVNERYAKQTYFLRTDGKGPLTENGGNGPDETRNWDDKKKDPRAVNLPWDAMSFELGDKKKRYTVVYLDRKSNPKEARFSERDYARIGSYFVADVTKDKPLEVNYRLWVQSGEMTVPQCAAFDADFDTPPTVTVK